MLETRKERITLLKAGIREKTIGKLYIACKDMRIINGNLLYTGKTFENLQNDEKSDKK